MSEPKAIIERCGRWTYGVHVEDGITRFGPAYGHADWTVWGRRRAERKARRALVLYRKHMEQHERWEIRP